LLRHSRPPFELIFVDVGSCDGTTEYLAGVADAAQVRVEVVSALPDRAFPGAVAEGIARARGAFLAWLNNDVLVPALWLQQLVGLVTMDATVGAVGPMSNVAPEQQRIPELPFQLCLRRGQGTGEAEARRLASPEAIDQFARDHRAQHQGEWGGVDRLGGFCFLLKREVLDKVPLLTSDDSGTFDADAFSARMWRAGYRLGCCRDLFVYHFGSRAVSWG
jgi:GT2 family glycosyltransferase